MSKFETIIDFLLEIFPTEQHCIDYFEEKRWKGNIVSPFDSTSQVYKCANNKYKCKKTDKYFNVRIGTIFEDSNVKLQKWFIAFYLLSSNKKGISTRQLVKYIKVTQKTAWFMLQRLRLAFEHPNFKDMLEGVVEIDEAFIGGSNPNRHWDKKVLHSQGRSWKDKVPVLGMVEKGGGSLFVQVVPNVKMRTLVPIIKNNVKEGSNLSSDEWYRNSGLEKWYNHQIVNHSIKQYVNGIVSTNAIENVWSHLKRIIIGIYHWVSRKHLQRYVDEFTFKFNTRNHNDEERFDLVLSSTIGKRLTYQQLIN